MKILCYGSLNIDMIFSVPHFVQAGETISSFSMRKSAGGKGANQASAIAKAGCDTYMAGKVGKDGRFLLEILEGYGVDCDLVRITDNPSGQALIQLTPTSQNAIILLAGENKNIQKEEIDDVLSKFSPGDWLVLQNEINLIEYIIEKAAEKGMYICFNPAPFDEYVRKLPLEKVSLLVVNEIEGAGLSGVSGDFEEIIGRLGKLYPNQEIIMTAGAAGAYYTGRDGFIYQPIIDYPVVDTTAAGDTFIGYYLASILRGFGVRESLYYASKASGIAVSRPGAMQSVPMKDEIFIAKDEV